MPKSKNQDLFEYTIHHTSQYITLQDAYHNLSNALIHISFKWTWKQEKKSEQISLSLFSLKILDFGKKKKKKKNGGNFKNDRNFYVSYWFEPH